MTATESAPLVTETRRRRRPVPIGQYLFAAVIIVAFLFPILYLVNTSLKSSTEFLQNPVSLVQDPQWHNFVDAWNQGNFARFILNSLLYTLAGAGIGTFVALLVGFPVARGYIRGAKYWYVVFVVALFLPNALVTQFHLLLKLGLYNTQLGYILILGAAVGVGPVLYSGFVRSLPRELDEAAAVDGVGYWRYLFTHVLPLSRPALVTVFILQAVWMWNEIILATVLIADSSKFPVTVGLYAFKGQYTNNWPLLAAATFIVAAPLILGYVFIQRYLVNGVVGSVKG